MLLELPRICLTGRWVDKGKRQDQSYYAPALPPTSSSSSRSRSSSENSLTSAVI